MSHLITHKLDDWPKSILSTIEKKYHLNPKIIYLQLYNDRLVYFKPILLESRYISLLLVTAVLPRQLFSHYHTDPSGGHMG